MQQPKGKTARFAAVVEVCGAPEPVALWVSPDQDKRFKAALQKERVMTVHQEGKRKDVGEVGFRRGARALYLIFPKSLAAFRDRRIVGIDYDLLATPKPTGRLVPGAGRRSERTVSSPFAMTRGQRLAAEEGEASQKRLYRVRVSHIAIVDQEVTVKAESRQTAREQALERTSKPDFAEATLVRKVRRVTEL